MTPTVVSWTAIAQFSSVQSLSRVQFFVIPWTQVYQASLSITNSQSWPKLMRVGSVMPSSHLILCRPLLLLPPIPPSIRVFSNESGLRMRWPKYWSFSLGISPSNEHPGLVSFRMDWWVSFRMDWWVSFRMDWWISLQSKGLARVFSGFLKSWPVGRTASYSSCHQNLRDHLRMEQKEKRQRTELEKNSLGLLDQDMPEVSAFLSIPFII